MTPHLRLVRELGRGGMGSVWVAEHLNLETEVAVKFIAAELGDRETALARFRREATAAAQIQSPHVVQIFDHGVTEDGTPFIVMELLRGESLAARLERGGRLALDEVRVLVAQLAKALGAAHHSGIVHRDLKPENVFCLEIPGAGDDELFVKLLDFGIARPAARASSQVTETGALIGTPAYMSPEQLGETSRIGPASDLWALGAVAYRALCGRLPFEGDTPVAYWRAMTTHSCAAPSTLERSLPAELDGWFRRAFRVEPEDRFASAREMAQGFEDIASRRAMPPATDDAPSASEPESETDGPAAEAATELATMGTVDFVAHEALGVEIDPRSTRPRAAHTQQPRPRHRKGTRDEAPAAAREAVAGPSIDEAASAHPRATGFAAALATGASRRWRQSSPRVVVYTAAVGVVAAMLWLTESHDRPAIDPADAVESSRDPVPAASASAEPIGSAAARPPEPALGLRALRDYHDPRGSSIANLKSASLWAAAAEDFAEAAQAEGAPVRWRAAHSFARCQLALVKGELATGLEACKRAAAIDPTWAMPYLGIAAAWSRQGNLEEALKAAEHAQRLEPAWWRAVAQAAAAYSRAERYAEGIQEFRRALELAPGNAVLLGELALMYHAARMDSEAARYADQALEADADVVPVRVLRAELALERGDGKAALVEATRAVSVAPKDVAARLAYADAHALLGHREQALDEYRRVERLRRTEGDGSAPSARLDLVETALRAGELPAARPALGRAGAVRSKPSRSRAKPASPDRSSPADNFELY